MFSSLPESFRAHGLSADVRTLLILRKAFEKELVKTLGDIYNVLKGIVVKEPTDLGPFTRAYYEYFLDISIRHDERLDDAILRSKTFQEWKTQLMDEDDLAAELSDEELVGKFLDRVHLTKYDIKEVISGKDIFDKDDPNEKDDDSNDTSNDEPAERNLEKMADYSDMSLEELLERMKKVQEQQKSNHSGGSHWIGTGGISPYGHGGAAKDGIRVGGTGGGRMARKVIGNKNYYPVDTHALLNDDNVDAALSAIKGVVEETAIEKLDVPFTIKEGLRRGGLFLPELVSETDERMRIIVLIDNGGYSMSPYIKTVRHLFSKMKTRFAHDLEVFYFHNTIYDVVYKDDRRSQRFPVDKLVKYSKEYRVFFIGDAAMAPYEINHTSVNSLLAITKQFKKHVWLNPEPLRYWEHTETIQLIKRIIPMYPLTPNGIERAVRHMNGKGLD